MGEENLRLYELDVNRRTRLKKHPELALPGMEEAVLQEDKVTKYLFNQQNATGWAKGVAFRDRLGYDTDSCEALREEIKNRAQLFPESKKGDKGCGMTYEQKMILFGKTGKPANVVVSWIVENGTPCMTSAYIKEVKERGD